MLFIYHLFIINVTYIWELFVDLFKVLNLMWKL